MDRSDGGVTAVPSASATSVSRRDSSTSGATTRSSSSNGTVSSTRQSGSSSANAGASNSHTSSSSSSYRSSGAGAEKSSSSSSHSLSRRNSGNEGSSSSSSARDRETRDSRDHHRDSRDSNSRDSRHSRDRDSRDSRSTQRGRSRSRESSRDYRDRDRGSSSSSHNNSQSHFGASGNPVVRLRERNNILVMHRTATRRSNLTPAEVAQRVYGLDTQFMKDTDNPNISEKLGPPGLFPTNMNLPEEKFRLHASRGTAFVNPLPRGFGTNWHLQYSFFTNKKFPVFDEVAQAANVIDRMEPVQDDASSSAGTSATQAAQVDHAFATYLIRNVRRIDERISHQWMSELASGKKTIPELVQSFGVPFKQWRPVPNVSKCPLLEYVVRYRPGFAEATWFIQINVVYVEMNEIKRDSTYRQGDWFHNPRRIQRRALGWTEQLVDYMHSLARQSGKTSRKETDTVENGNMIGLKDFSNFKSHAVNRRHGDMGMGVDSSGFTVAQSGSSTPSQLSFHEKWSYLLKLSEYQFKMGLLDRSRYFDGLLSMLQKALTPRRRSGNSSTVLILSVNDIMELISVLQNLLDDLLLCTEGVILLVKTVVQHLRYLLPPGSKIPSEPLSSPLQEDLVVSLCQILRGILLNAHDVLVRLEDNGPHTWPAFVLSNRFYDRSVFSEEEIDSCVKRCRQLSAEVSGRILRVQQLCSQSFHHASQRNEVQLIQCLDRFHRVDATVDLARVYNEVFAQMPVSPVLHELPVDVSAVFLVCEWAVTSHRPAEYRYLTAVSLLEMHSSAQLDFGKENGLLRCSTIDHQVVLQGALQSFLQRYKPKMISEVTQLIDMFCLLVRRRLFSVDSFVEFAACMIESTADEVPAPAPVMSPNGNRIPASSSSANPTSATIVSTAYNIECAPGRGYKSSDIPLLTTAERLRLYLWQLPRGPTPLPTSVPMIPDEFYDPELSLLRWLDVMELRREHLSHSKTLERAQSLCVFVFHTHGEVNDPNDPSNKDRVMKEVDYQGKVGELVSAVKTMCGHDKGRFTTWFLKNIYEETSFFRFSELGSVEHIVRLVCLVLEIVDILALMEVIVFFLRRSPASLVKNVVVTMIERHEIVFWSTGQILLLMKTFVDRFKMMPKSIADDKNHSVAKFFCVLYNAHAKQKEIEKLDLPVPLLHAIAQALRKNQDGNQKQKELSLEASNIIARIPPPRETIPPEVKSALSRSFKALQSRNFADGTGTDAKPQTVSTPLASPDSQGGQTATEPSYEAPVFSSMVWREVVIEASEASESKCRDGAIDYAATAINMSMSASVGATNANATRERKTPNYVFFLRAVLSEIMDKWMASVMARTKHNYRRPIMTPHYVHRCVRLIREIMEQHPDGEDFQEKFTNTLVVWLQKEVLPGFAGSESQRRVRNPFINMENGREAFVMNQKGRLDKLQYGLKAFLVSLIVHKVLDLTQVLRLVLVPLFPRLRRASRDPPPNLPSQLLAMALVYQLFSEPPQNVVLDAQKIVMFDEPMTKYHLRHLRTQVPAGLMFPLVHLLCQISYQMEEENFTLRRREERGTLASYALFNLTSDGIVRDIIFHDTKEAREKHILPVYQKKQWHTAVLLTHFFRPPNSPAEDQNGQVQLLKVEQIIDQMNVWVLNRGGSIYLDLQMSRQQQKAKRAVKSSSRQSAKRQATNDNSTRPAKRRRGTHNVEEPMLVTGYLDPASSDDEEDIEIDESSSATETLANLIVLRTLRKASRPPALHHSTSLYSVSPIPTPHLFTPVPVAGIHDESPHYVVCSSSSRWKHPFVNHNMHPGALTDAEISASVAAHEAQEASVASLYAATVCSISRRTMGSVIAKVLQVLEDDVKSPLAEKHSGQNVNGTTVVRLISGVMCTPPGAAFLPRYMMSVATQLESLFEACSAVDQSDCADASAVKRLRRKLAVRLQLVAVVCQNKHIAPTICYRNRIVKTLFYLLGTSTTSQGSGLSLFSWILDLIPLVNGAVLHDKHFELVASLNLPDDLKRRVWTIFPRPTSGADAVYLRSAKQAFRPVDPWGLLDHVSPLPSDDVILMPQVVQPKRRRVFRCA